MAEPQPEYGEDAEDDGVNAENVEEVAQRKFYVDDGAAYVVAEGIYLPDPPPAGCASPNTPTASPTPCAAAT